MPIRNATLASHATMYTIYADWLGGGDCCTVCLIHMQMCIGAMRTVRYKGVRTACMHMYIAGGNSAYGGYLWAVYDWHTVNQANGGETLGGASIDSRSNRISKGLLLYITYICVSL